MPGTIASADLERGLVNATWLAQHLNTPSLRLFDVRCRLTDASAGRKLYAAGHIPGAYYLDLETDLSRHPRHPTEGRHPLPEPQVFAATMQRHGVDPSSHVVVKYDVGGAIAARLWWMLQWLGHTQVAVLNGGIQAWEHAARPLETTTPPTPRPAQTRLGPARPELLCSIDTVAARSKINQISTPPLIDARDGKRFRGEHEPIDPRPGHIPGAQNAPFAENLVGPNGVFCEKSALRERFAALGVRPGDATVHYCGSGVTACHNILAMHHAGLGLRPLFVGSFSAWSSDLNRPVQTGAPSPAPKSSSTTP